MVEVAAPPQLHLWLRERGVGGYENACTHTRRTHALDTVDCNLRISCRSRTELAGVGDCWYRRRFLAVRNGGKSVLVLVFTNINILLQVK